MIVNNLFLKLTQVLRKQTGPNAAIVPFSMGRVYQTIYRNFKHDPRPLLLILGSDAFYTIGINIHYIASYQTSLISFIMLLRQSQTMLNGYTLYQLLKTRLPMVPKTAFRKYFTAMLSGKLVSEGISVLPEPNIVKFIAEPWVVRLNLLIRPRIFSYRKEQFNPNDVASVRDQVVQTDYYKDRQKPFAAAERSIVQYRKPEGT